MKIIKIFLLILTAAVYAKNINTTAYCSKSILYKEGLHRYNIVCNKNGTIFICKNGKIANKFNFKKEAETDAGFICDLKLKNGYLFMTVPDGLMRLDIKNRKKDLVVAYDGIGTLMGYVFNKNGNKVLSWGGDINQTVKITDLKSLKSKTVAKIDLSKISKALFGNNEKNIILIMKNGSKKIISY